MSLAIIHFEPIEKYPPAMNLLYLLSAKSFTTCVFSTHYSDDWFNARHIHVHRLGKNKISPIWRYLTYLRFNLGTFWRLIYHRPKKILCFETLSIVPAWWYKKIFRKTELYMHYHEFASDEEKNAGSAYMQWLYNIEKNLLSYCTWVSHTNIDRLIFFRKQHTTLNPALLHSLPNYPLITWTSAAMPKKKQLADLPVRLVYVGAIDTETMHLNYMCDWVLLQKGKYQLTLISDNISDRARNYLSSLVTDYIELKPGIRYDELPMALLNYHIGLVLYNGHIPNFIYNIPNKVTEYLHCGLDVWIPASLMTTLNWAQENKMIKNELTPENIKALSYAGFQREKFCAEEALGQLIGKLTDDNKTGQHI